MDVNTASAAVAPPGPFGLSPVSGFGSSPFGGLSPYGSFGPPYYFGLAPPPPLLLPYGATGAVETGGGTSLRGGSGNPVSTGTTTDQNGNAVMTATLGTNKGDIIAFTSTRPDGLTPGLASPSLSSSLPTLTDSTGQAVPYRVSTDQQGGTVLQIQLSDTSGQRTTLYAQVDTNGFPTGPNPLLH